MAYNGKDERYVVRGGIAIPIGPDGVTSTGKVLPHNGGEVIQIPAWPKKWWSGKPRRIVVYPDGSPRPYPLASPHKLDPEAMKDSDILNLYGPYPPTLLRRAMGNLLAEFEKIRLKDWIVIGIAFLALAASSVGAYYAYQTFKMIRHLVG